MGERVVLKGNAKLLEPVITQFMAIYQLIADRDVGNIYGRPTHEVQADFKFHPEVGLLFKEAQSEFLIENGLNRAEAEISFRLMHETPATYTHEKAYLLAKRIKSVLMPNKIGFTWEKGTHHANYLDFERGYKLSIFAQSDIEAIRVIEKILSIQEHPYSADNLTIGQPKKVYPVIPPMVMVYGKERRAPRRKPITEVHFSKAELKIHGIAKSIILVGRNEISEHP